MTYLFFTLVDIQCRAGRVLIAMFSASLLGVVLLALTLGLLTAVAASSPRPALAQGGGNGFITHTTVSDFGAACKVMTNTSLSGANGGEIRLAATVEDYFDGTTIDNSRWYSRTVYTWYNVLPTVSGGVLTLEANYLRSQISISQTTPMRFFEARALQRVNTNNAGWPDLGFYRELPPLDYGETITYPSDSALRIFVTRDTNTTFARGRDGDASSPLIDIDVPTLDLMQYHNFRIEWDTANSYFYVDGSQVATITGVSTLTTWVFLYHQTPTTFGASPMQVDWVRAGVYPASGSYVSCVQDGGGIVNWATLSAATNLPAGTSASLETRTSVDGVNWSGWAAITGETISSPSGRYFQYRTNLSTSNVTRSPEVQQVSVSYFGPNSVVVTPSLVALNPGGVQQYSAQAYDQNSRPVSSLNYSWQVVNGGGVINSSGLFTAGNVSAGNYTNTVRANTAGAGTVNGFATVTVNNVAPVAEAGGPYFAAINQSITVNGLGSSDPNGDSLSYGWDLDNDGQYDDAFTAMANYSWGVVGTYTVRLLVTDTLGLTGTDTAQAVVNTAYLYLPIILR
jgi:hypothetical protein